MKPLDAEIACIKKCSDAFTALAKSYRATRSGDSVLEGRAAQAQQRVLRYVIALIDERLERGNPYENS